MIAIAPLPSDQPVDTSPTLETAPQQTEQHKNYTEETGRIEPDQNERPVSLSYQDLIEKEKAITEQAKILKKHSQESPDAADALDEEEIQEMQESNRLVH